MLGAFDFVFLKTRSQYPSVEAHSILHFKRRLNTFIFAFVKVYVNTSGNK